MATQQEPALILQQFITSGCVKFQTTHPAEFHKRIFETCAKLGVTDSGNGTPLCEVLGDDMLPEMPELTQLFECPNVREALEAILGPNPILDPHRFCHLAVQGRRAQAMHMDGYQSTGVRAIQARAHRPTWILAMYYPQEVTDDMGPTAVVPGSHYLHLDDPRGQAMNFARVGEQDIPAVVSEWGMKEEEVLCPAGTLVLCHYDAWHRATSSSSPNMRFMVKFIFSRGQLPTPTDVAPDPPVPWDAVPLPKQLRCVWETVWAWAHGAPLPSLDGGDGDPPGGGEVERVAWAYRAGAAVREGRRPATDLTKMLRAGEEPRARLATEGLSWGGEAAAKVLIPLLTEALPDHKRATAAYALGWAGGGELGDAALTQAAGQGPTMTRVHALQGMLGRPSAADAAMAGLRCRAGEVQANAARLLAAQPTAVVGQAQDKLQDIVQNASRDHTLRYAVAFAAEALFRSEARPWQLMLQYSPFGHGFGTQAPRKDFRPTSERAWAAWINSENGRQNQAKFGGPVDIPPEASRFLPAGLPAANDEGRPAQDGKRRRWASRRG